MNTPIVSSLYDFIEIVLVNLFMNGDRKYITK